MLYREKEERNVRHTVKRKEDNWIGYICCRNCIVNRVIEGKVELMGRRGKVRKSCWMAKRKGGILEIYTGITVLFFMKYALRNGY